MLSALGVGLLCGLWNGFLVAILDIQPIIATLILMVSGRGIGLMINLLYGGTNPSFSSPLPGSVMAANCLPDLTRSQK